MTTQTEMFNALTTQYNFTKELDNTSDYFEVYEANGIIYYHPNDEDLGGIFALDFKNKLALYTAFYDTEDFKPVTYGDEIIESDYLVINKNGTLMMNFEAK